MAYALRAPRRSTSSRSFAVLDLQPTVAPPSAALIEAIQTYADIEDAEGARWVRRRISAARLAQLEARGLIDVPAERAADVAILWDLQEEQIVRVLDDAPLRVRASHRPASFEHWWDAPARPRLASVGVNF